MTKDRLIVIAKAHNYTIDRLSPGQYRLTHNIYCRELIVRTSDYNDERLINRLIGHCAAERQSQAELRRTRLKLVA